MRIKGGVMYTIEGILRGLQINRQKEKLKGKKMMKTPVKNVNLQFQCLRRLN